MGPIHLNGWNMILITWSYTLFVNYFQIFSVTFELEPGAVGHTTDFKEANKRLEWGLKKVILIVRFSTNNQYIFKHWSMDVHKESFSWVFEANMSHINRWQ